MRGLVVGLTRLKYDDQKPQKYNCLENANNNDEFMKYLEHVITNYVI